MVQNISRREEQRGWRKLFLWGLAIAVVLGIVVIIGPFFTTPERTGMEETTRTPAQAVDERKNAAVATIETKEVAKFGAYLTDGFGRAVYLFEGDEQGRGDTPAVSTCYGECAKAWPPIISSDRAVAGGEADDSLLGIVKRRNGEQQVTYNGWPLYHFARDFGSQETTGHDLEDFGAEWYLVKPSGEKVHAEEEGAS